MIRPDSSLLDLRHSGQRLHETNIVVPPDVVRRASSLAVLRSFVAVDDDRGSTHFLLSSRRLSFPPPSSHFPPPTSVRWSGWLKWTPPRRQDGGFFLPFVSFLSAFDPGFSVNGDDGLNVDVDGDDDRDVFVSFLSDFDSLGVGFDEIRLPV